MRNNEKNIDRKEAIRKIGKYSKYAALTALGTYLLLNPKSAQSGSFPDPPGDPFV